MRLTLIIHNLNCGGAERVMSVMANYWATRGHDITLLTFDDGSQPPFYDLNPRVRHLPLDVATEASSFLAGMKNNVVRLRVLRRAVDTSRPAAVISFLPATNILSILATRGLKARVLVSERNDPALFDIGGVWTALRFVTYPMADCVVVQTRAAQKYFPSFIRTITHVIENPIPAPDERAASEKVHLEPNTIIALGRLHPIKGFDLLLKAFAKVAGQHPEYSLMILGEGGERAHLEELRDTMGLKNGRVLLPGEVRNPYPYLKQAAFFVLSSRREGFPNALCEAMAAGLPVISTDCRSGPAEIIRQGVDGLLVPVEDVETLAEAMDQLMRDGSLRRQLSERAPEILERFKIDNVMAKWEACILGKKQGVAGQ